MSKANGSENEGQIVGSRKRRTSMTATRIAMANGKIIEHRGPIRLEKTNTKPQNNSSSGVNRECGLYDDFINKSKFPPCNTG